MATYDDTHKPVTDSSRKQIEQALRTGGDLPEGTILDFSTNRYLEPKRTSAKATASEDKPVAAPKADDKPATAK